MIPSLLGTLTMLTVMLIVGMSVARERERHLRAAAGFAAATDRNLHRQGGARIDRRSLARRSDCAGHRVVFGIR